MRRWLPFVLGLAVVAIVAIGLVQSSENTPETETGPTFDLTQALAELEGSPPELAALHEQAGTLVKTSPGGFKKLVDDLGGRPIVINQWGSWCGPCRAEFPILQRVATDYGKDVAFLGINGQDPQDRAKEFLDESPLPYPSYVDRSGIKFTQAIGRPAPNYPTTIFIDAGGKITYVKQGDYRRDQDLADDIERYLGV